MGFQDLARVLEKLPDEIQRDVMVRAVTRACKPIEIAAKRFAKRSERTGALRDSITTKAVNYKRAGKTVGLVGPRRGYYRRGKALKAGADRRGADSPSHYAHLVEYGHHAVAPVKGTTLRPFKKKAWKPAKLAAKGKQWVPAKPFIRPAVLTTKAQQSAEFVAGLKSGYQSAVRKLVKSGAHVKS